ncbi:hypothetical protein XH90_30210 [Bradyrhizobium sp. CCBAU 53338]|nr:hypothetical protein XH90_30210 [Bradyrhizobium sp. CCBAU 53338]
MVFLPHASLWQAGPRGRRTCLTLEAITPELDANSSRKPRFRSAHKLAKIRRPPPHAAMPMLGLQAMASQRKLQNLRL